MRINCARAVSSLDALVQQLQQVEFIVWDKVAMQHRHIIECFDQTWRDLTGIDFPFGGKVVLFSGDFRQTLPIVRRSILMEQAAASLKASFLWNEIETFALTVNVCLGGAATRPDPINMGFQQLAIGSGIWQSTTRSYRSYPFIILQCHCCLSTSFIWFRNLKRWIRRRDQHDS